MTSRAGTIIEVASSWTVSRSGISIVSSVRAGAAAAVSPFFLRCRSFSSSSSFSRSFFAAALSSWMRDAIARDARTARGRGRVGQRARRRAGAGPGACRGLSARNGPLPAGRRGGAIGRGGAAARGGARAFPALPGSASPGRGATPGRPGRPVRGPGEADARGRGRRSLALDDRWLTGRHRAELRNRLGGPARRRGARRRVAGPAGGSAARRRAGKAAAPCGGRATVARDPARRGAGAYRRSRRRCGAAPPVRGAAPERRFGGARAAPAAAGAAALAFGGAVCGLALSSTLRTRSAIWSGTTLSWFLPRKSRRGAR